MASLEASWREALAEESAAAATDERERARSKAAILARFDLQASRGGEGSCGRRGPKPRRVPRGRGPLCCCAAQLVLAGCTREGR